MKTSRFCHFLRNVIMDVITFPYIYKPLVVYRFYCMALFHSKTRRHVINLYKHLQKPSEDVVYLCRLLHKFGNIIEKVDHV